MAEKKTRRPGVPCPVCGERQSKVLRTVPKDHGLQRIRRCAKCGLRFVTGETTTKADTCVTTLNTAITAALESLGHTPRLR